MATWVNPTGDTAMAGRSVFSHHVAALAPQASAVAGRWEPAYHADHSCSRAKSLGREKTTTMPLGGRARWLIGSHQDDGPTRRVPPRHRVDCGRQRVERNGLAHDRPHRAAAHEIDDLATDADAELARGDGPSHGPLDRLDHRVRRVVEEHAAQLEVAQRQASRDDE